MRRIRYRGRRGCCRRRRLLRPTLSELGATPSFTAYTASGFGIREQHDLVAVAKAAARRGATVIISNHYTPAARDLYRDFELHSVVVRRSLSTSTESLGMAKELVAVLSG